MDPTQEDREHQAHTAPAYYTGGYPGASPGTAVDEHGRPLAPGAGGPPGSAPGQGGPPGSGGEPQRDERGNIIITKNVYITTTSGSGKPSQVNRLTVAALNYKLE